MAAQIHMEIHLQHFLLVIIRTPLINDRYLTNDSKIASLNCGYALLTESGETLQLNSKTDRHQRFQYQMYHYAALGIKFQESLEGKRVLDLGCGRGGGCKTR